MSYLTSSSQNDDRADLIEHASPASPNAASASRQAPVLVLDALISPVDYAPGPNASLSAVPDVPPESGSSGTVLQVTISALAAGTDSTTTRELALDLAPYATRDAVFTVWSKALSLANLEAVYFLFSFPESGYAAYRIVPADAAIWQKFAIPMAAPSSASGVDWSNVTRLAMRIDAATEGRYTGRVRFHELCLSSAPNRTHDVAADDEVTR